MGIKKFFDDMKKTSEELNKILEEGYSETMLEKFKETALRLKWKGEEGDAFRQKVLETIKAIGNGKKEMFLLKTIANIPKEMIDFSREQNV